MPKVSTVIPVFNTEKFLARCLNGVLSRSMPDVDTVCVNDGSTDGSSDILQKYAAKDSRIKVINQGNNQSFSMPRIAVHMHLYYAEQLGDFLQRLDNLSGTAYDLYVTMGAKNAEAERTIKAFKKDANIRITPNLGYDVGPFIDFLHHINLDDYDYIIKIHTKRVNGGCYSIFNNHRFDMRIWRETLLDAVISEKAVTNNLRILARDDTIGMISSDYILTDEKWSYQNTETQVEEEMVRIGLKMPQDRHFVAGTMFWVRAKLLKPFLAYEIEDFDASDEQVHDETLAHVLERMFCLAVTAQGYQIIGVHFKSFFWTFMKAKFKRFLFQKKKTRKGHLIVKVCKIPVYYRKEIS